MNYYFVRVAFYNGNKLPLGNGTVIAGYWKWQLFDLNEVGDAIESSKKLRSDVTKNGLNGSDIHCEIVQVVKV